MLLPASGGAYTVAGRDHIKTLCPYCKHNYVLYVWPGGFMSCFREECKMQALDAAMDQETKQRLH